MQNDFETCKFRAVPIIQQDNSKNKFINKDYVHPITGHEDPEGD